MRLFADTNIMAPAVARLRQDGHDVIHSAERPADPGDAALLAEAVADHRVFLTKDHDFGALVFRDGLPHAGILLIDDLGDPAAEAMLLQQAIASHEADLLAGRFVRIDGHGARISGA